MDSKESDSMEKVLRGLLYRASCPAPDFLLQYQLGSVAGTEVRQFDQHLADCPHCSAEIALLTEAVPTPISWLDKARDWLRGVVGDLGGVVSAENQTPAQPAFAVKGDDDDAPQIFSGGPYRISLTVQGNGLQASGRRIEGSVVNVNEPLAELEGKVYLTDTDTMTRSELLDDFGYFMLDELPTATYTLLFMLPERSVWIESFDVA